MNNLSIYVWKNIFHGLFFLFFWMLFATSAFGAELLPFPSKDRRSQYQRTTPQYHQQMSPSGLAKFRMDITRFQCSELDALYNRLRDQYDAAKTASDKEYYNYFLNELYREKSGRCQ